MARRELDGAEGEASVPGRLLHASTCRALDNSFHIRARTESGASAPHPPGSVELGVCVWHPPTPAPTPACGTALLVAATPTPSPTPTFRPAPTPTVCATPLIAHHVRQVLRDRGWDHDWPDPPRAPPARRGAAGAWSPASVVATPACWFRSLTTSGSASAAPPTITVSSGRTPRASRTMRNALGDRLPTTASPEITTASKQPTSPVRSSLRCWMSGGPFVSRPTR